MTNNIKATEVENLSFETYWIKSNLAEFPRILSNLCENFKPSGFLGLINPFEQFWIILKQTESNQISRIFTNPIESLWIRTMEY